MHCPHHPTCPGCPLLDLPYREQLANKRARLALALSRYPHLPPAPRVMPAVRTEGYRHRLKLPIAVKDGHAAIGLYHPRTGEVLDTPDCPVLAQPLRDALAALMPRMKDHPEVHSLDLRASHATGELQAVIAADGGSFKGGRREVAELRRLVPGLASVAISTADPLRKRVMGRKPELVSGEPFIREAIGGTNYRLHPGAFFQVDPANAVQLQDMVREAAGAAKTILDLYAGVGAYALALAAGRVRVLAVEEVRQAAEAARAVAPPNVEVVSDKVENLALSEPFDVVILNPARRGSDPASLARLSKIANRAIYVSCGPETLARDLDILAAHGMRVVSVQAVDLFPQTPEVETIVLLERGPALVESPTTSGGRARSPWLGTWSGAIGRETEALALVIGDPGPHGNTPAGRWTRLGMVATHALLRFELRGPFDQALRTLAGRGHPPAGRDPRTAAFFAEKAGLVRPFEHVLRTQEAFAPLHGDLVEALIQLGADPAWATAVASGHAPQERKGAPDAGRRGHSGGRKR